ncbi:MAG TPA: TolC family protein, partial [Candidatus Obscuribacterales bacterium]
RHPLLRNTFNGLRQLSVSENNVTTSLWNLKQEAIDTVAEVQDAYWDLVLFRERLRVLEQSLQILQELLKMNQEKEKAGFMARIDNLQTEARIASLQANLLDARRNIENTEDRLRQLLNPDADPALDWNMDLVPTDQPVYKAYATALEQSYTTALKVRPDYQVQLVELQNSALREEIAAQNLLPQLDFTGRAGLESLDSNYFGALGKLFSFQTYSWNVGFAFEMPVIGNPYAHLHEQTLLQKQQQELRLSNARQQIQRDLRQSIRNVEMSAKQIEATRLAKKLAEEQLKAQTEKLNLGLTTNFQVLQFQTDFVQASLDEANAIVEYIQAINQLQRSEGTLLEAQQIAWPTP